MTSPLYYLGCPVWACDQWTGSLFTRHAKRAEWLEQYSSVFGTVEGNSTFYGLPSTSTVERWARSVASGFRFALKFPRAISHENRLHGAAGETQAFLKILETLAKADCLGPSFLQLPPSFSCKQFSDLERYLRSLPKDFPYAVEPRHKDFFDEGDVEGRLDDLLRELRVDRVVFDSRPLFSGPPSDDDEAEAQRRKPRPPVHTTTTAKHALLRFVGRNNVDTSQPWIEEWAPVIAAWIKEGLTPYVFAHTPNDAYAPELARRLHQETAKHCADIGALPAWPGESEERQPRQLELF
ncbi:MAG: DUF72 domain-containing protein [Planctomycetes bacterium]|nr:DUF72 domain-containing protein [Planctomycetota bacterium]